MADDAAAIQEPAILNEVSRINHENVEAGTTAGREQRIETAEAPDNAAKKPRKRRTNEEISLSGLIQNRKKRAEKRADICQHVEGKLGELSRRCGDDFLLVMVHSTTIKVKSSKALGGIASSSWLDLNQTVPAFLAQTAAQERLATQTGRFKDHTFQKLDRTTQIKVVEVMLDSSIKNRKGVLAYAKNPGTEEVLKLASWWPQEVKYAAPRSMPEEDLCKVFAALIKYADSNDDLLLRRLEASVGCLGVDTMDQLAINAAIKALTRKEEPALDTAENDSGTGDNAVVEEDGKLYLQPTGTTAAALKKCQLSHLPEEEHKKKYVKEGKISVCKTMVALTDLYNAVTVIGGISRIKKKRKTLRLALKIKLADYSKEQLQKAYKKYLSPLLLPANSGDASEDPAPHPARPADAGRLSEEGISCDEHAGNISDQDPSAADPGPPASDTCPLSSRLTARQITSERVPATAAVDGPGRAVAAVNAVADCGRAPSPTGVACGRRTSSNQTSAASDVGREIDQPTVIVASVPVGQGSKSPYASRSASATRTQSRVLLQAATPGAMAAAQVLSGSLPAGDPALTRKSSRRTRPSAKLQQMGALSSIEEEQL